MHSSSAHPSCRPSCMLWGPPHEGCVVPFVVAGYVGGLIGLVNPGLFTYQALPCIEAVGCC